MYHRQTGRRHAKKSRTAVEMSKDGSYEIVIDQLKHKPFSETQFSQFAQQMLNVLQRTTAYRRHPHDASVPTVLSEDRADDR